MIKKLKSLLWIAAAALPCCVLMISCESDADQLGAQLVQPGGATGTLLQKDVIAFNVDNNDTIRTDASKLDSVVIGAFSEGNFGLQKASYVTQLRLNEYNPDFGTNAVADSAVLVLKPAYYSDSVKTNILENYTFSEGNVPAKKTVNTYPVAYKYGKQKINGTPVSLTLQVHEVTDFLSAPTEKQFSNKTVGVGTLLGEKMFDGKVTSISITKKSDNSDLYKRDANIRIPLSASFFQSKIIAKKGLPELSDAASFIRYFKGLRISVAQNDGYMFKFAPSSVELQLYYKNDLVKDGVTTRPQSVFTFNFGTDNTRISQITNNRTGTPYAAAMATAYHTPVPAVAPDPVPAAKLYAQGMGGAGFGIKIPQTTIEELRTLYKNNKAGISSAKIRVYTEASSWAGKYAKPANFVVKQEGSDSYLTEFTSLLSSGYYALVTPFDLNKNPAHYDISITETLKNIVEKEAPNKNFIVNVGAYTVNSFGILTGKSFPDSQNYNTRSYTPNRVVLVGSAPNNEQRAQLLIAYSQK